MEFHSDFFQGTHTIQENCLSSDLRNAIMSKIANGEVAFLQNEQETCTGNESISFTLAMCCEVNLLLPILGKYLSETYSLDARIRGEENS